MKRIIPLFSIIILYSLASPGQDKKYEYYFDDDFKLVKKTKSTFTGTGTLEGNLVLLQIADNKTGQAIILSHYTDSSLKVRQGSFQSFFTNGIKQSEGSYDQGKENGLWKVWDDKGRLVDSTVFDNGNKIIQATYKYYRKGNFTYKFEDLKNNSMREVSYNDSGAVNNEAIFTGNSGIIKTHTKDGVQTDSVFSRESIAASFPGGDAAWARYIKTKIENKIGEITDDKQSGTCRVRFMIDTEGNVSNLQVLSMSGSVLAGVVQDALLKGPKWNPAVKYGKPVNAYREQPVTFTIGTGTRTTR